MSIELTIETMAQHAKTASKQLRKLKRSQKDLALQRMADNLLQMEGDIVHENQKDLSLAKERGLIDPEQ